MAFCSNRSCTRPSEDLRNHPAWSTDVFFESRQGHKDVMHTGSSVRASAGERPHTFATKAADTRVSPAKPVIVDQVLPDGHRVAAPSQRLDNQLSVRLAGARPRGSARSRGDHGVGEHLGRGGRFWRPVPGPTAPPTHRDAGRLQIAAGRLPADARRLLDAPQRPTQSPQRQALLSCVFAQDVAHAA